MLGLDETCYDSDASESDTIYHAEDKVPEVLPEMAARFSLGGLNLSHMSHEEVVGLLDLIDLDIREQSFDDETYPITLRLLQDLCYYFCAIPSSFIVEHVTFSRSPKDIIGRGGEATLYRGRLRKENRSQLVVVREVGMAAWEWDLPSGREVTRLVHREAITHSLLDHPNILPFLGIYHEEINSPPITILPLMERGSLQKRLACSPVELNTLQRILVGISRGVVYLHSRRPPIIHGDLHPGNVLLDIDDHPYLCDFGLSRIRHEVTRTRTILREGGMRRFMAPELANGMAERFGATLATDVFSLAMMFLNTWSGRPPFSEVRKDVKVAAKFRDGLRPQIPPNMFTEAPELRQQLWTLLERMWAQTPTDRPASSDVLESLTQIFASVPPPPLSYLPTPPQSCPPSSTVHEWTGPMTPPEDLPNDRQDRPLMLSPTTASTARVEERVSQTKLPHIFSIQDLIDAKALADVTDSSKPGAVSKAWLPLTPSPTPPAGATPAPRPRKKMSSLSKKNHLARTETGLSTPVEIRVNISATVTLNTPSPEKGHAKRRREEESWDDYASDDDAKLARKRPKVDGPVPDEMDLAASLAAALGNSQTATSFMSTALAETFSNQGLTSLGNTAPEDITSGTSSGLNLFNWEPSFQQSYTEEGQFSFSASSLSSFSLFQQDGNMN